VGKLKLFQRLHFGKMGITNPPRYRVTFPLFYLGLQQCFQITEMTFLFLYGLLCHLPRTSLS